MSRPRLKVVSADPRPRHVAAWAQREPNRPPLRCSIELWTDAEWEALHPAERPANPGYLPGFGWIAVTAHAEADEGWRDAVDAYSRCTEDPRAVAAMAQL